MGCSYCVTEAALREDRDGAGARPQGCQGSLPSKRDASNPTGVEDYSSKGLMPTPRRPPMAVPRGS